MACSKKDRKIGVIIPQYGHGFEDILSVSRNAEKLGYDSIWSEDHLQSWIGEKNRDTLECWTTLSALARETNSIRIGTLVTCQSYRHPSLLAKMAATVDNLSNGRLELGLGAGWYEDEYTRFGFKFQEPTAKRLNRLRETILILKGLWTQETFSYSEDDLELKEAFCKPKPVQEPHPPIWIGGGGEKYTLKHTAELADGWNYGTLDPKGFAEKLSILKKYCESEERFHEIKKSAEIFVFVDISNEKAEEKRKKFKDQYLPGKPSEPREFFLSNYIKTALVGTPTQIEEKLREYEEIGISTFMFKIPDAARDNSLDLLAKRLL